jgi:hypothetical protein
MTTYVKGVKPPGRRTLATEFVAAICLLRRGFSPLPQA